MPTSTHHSCRRGRFGVTRSLAAATAGVAGIALTAGAVYATMSADASNTTAEQVSSGTLKLVLSDRGAGFGQQIADIAPTDVVNRYVDLANTGTLAGRALTVAVADAAPTALTTDAVRGLHVTVSQCAGATWDPTSGQCGAGGTVTKLIDTAALAALAATPAAVSAGTLAPGDTVHLQVAVALPDQVETTVNGVLPVNTIQGLSASLTWTFAEAQRTGVTTNN
ncbi:Camelysin metallo-endopeptidase [Jatrophihabitans endophyticus]|uniref:Camelysin metallo-endopeptidase n=1 Tax=Jatrophihabitans endophyticus TaxID=1206085 RepID=A0A1M5U024_9ACTN|nr:TasA family protein [Jatrophihabitans endophyticus]SHH56231.1 Camelysin metallo-endopeptidase [Jatrophihabitans endophyticus]